MKKVVVLYFAIGLISILCSTYLITDYVGANTPSEGASNALPDAAYDEFGLSINKNTPSDFGEGGDDPLEGFKPSVPSWLYMGGMNQYKKMEWQGGFNVYKTLNKVSQNGLTIDEMALPGKDVFGPDTIGKYTSFPNSNNSKNFEYHTQNAIALDMGKDSNNAPLPAMIVDTTLYSADQNFVVKNKKKSKKSSQQMLTLYGQDDKQNWVVCDTKTNYLVDENTNNLDFFNNNFNSVDQEGKGGITSLSAGDFDYDGVDEVAVYIPSKIKDQLLVKVYKVSNKKLKLWKSIDLRNYLTILSKPTIGMNTPEFYQWYMPVVSLATTGISGKDELVVSVSLPLISDSYSGLYDQNSSLAIYGLNKDEPECKYRDSMSYSGYRMRYINAVDSDINGNGTKELIVGGYINHNNGINSVGTLDSSQNGINAIVWDGKNYKQVWDEPIKVAAHGDSKLNTDYVMTEPVALASGNYDGFIKEKVFLEGVLFDFTPKDDNDSDDEVLNLKSGSFNTLKKMTLNSDRFANKGWISTCVTGNFGKQDGPRQQTMIMYGDHNSTDLISHEINYHLAWIWKDSGTIKIDNTNTDFYYHRAGQDKGTFLTPCVVPDYQQGTYYKFKEKDYGWSAPEVLAIMPSIPNWDELSGADGNTFDAGSTSFTIESGYSHKTEGNIDIGLGTYLSTSIGFGIGLASNELTVGPTFNLDIMGNFIHSHSEEHSTGQAIQYTAAAGEDNVVVFAMPLVIYTYDVWVPTFTVTQDDIDSYNQLNEEIGGTDPYPYKPGDVVKGHLEECNVSYQYNPVNHVLPLEEYNDLAEKYKYVDKVNMDKIMKHEVGDPSLYPREINEIVSYDSSDVRSMSSTSLLIDTKGSTTVNLSKEHTHENTTGFDLVLNTSLGVKTSDKLQLGITTSLEMEKGVEFSIGGGCQWSGATINGNEFTGTFNALPQNAKDYQFNTAMAVWDVMPDGSKAKKATSSNKNESKKWMDTGSFVIGYTSSLLDDSSIPPKLPQNAFVYASTNEDMILSWDIPGDYRKASYYEAYIKKGNDYYQLNPKKINPNSNYMVVDGLKPDTVYEFAFKAVNADSSGTVISESVMSRSIIGHTRADKSISFTTPPTDCYVDKGDTASFSAEVKTTKPGNVSYQWYKYNKKSANENNSWQQINGAVKSEYSVGKITDDNKDELNGTKYKLRVTQYPDGSNNPVSIDSKVVTLFIGKAARPTVDISMKSAKGKKLIQKQNEYYKLTDSKKNGTVILNANLKKESGEVITSGEVTFIIMDSDGNRVKKLKGSAPDKEGKSTAQWDLSQFEPGTYDVEALLTLQQQNALSQVSTLHYLKVDTTVYKIYYELNGGVNNPANPPRIWINSPGIDLEPATKEDAKFTGWYSDSELKNSVETLIPSEMKGSITLYAGFEDIQYDIDYKLDGGENSPDNPKKYTVSDNITLLPATKTGYEFMGWFEDEEKTKKIEILPSGKLRDLTLYAKWEIIDYPITYVLSGGINSDENPVTYTVEDTVVFADPTNGKQKFEGWYDDSLFESKKKKIKKGSTGSVTIYAKWGAPPLYDPDDPLEERTLTNDENGITVTGTIHPSAVLQVISYSDDSINQEIIKDGLPSDKNIAGAYKIQLLYPDFTDAKYEGNLELSFDLSDMKDIEKNDIKVIEFTDDKKIEELETSLEGNIVTVKSGTLNIFAPVGDPIKVKSIRISSYLTMIAPGDVINLVSEITPKNAYNNSLQWNSSNDKVAKVDNKGQVKGVGEGDVTITAKAKDGSKVTGNFKLTVAKNVTKINTPVKTVYMKKGSKMTIPAVAYSPGSNTAKMAWSSSNSKIASVDTKGKVSLKKKGNATLTVKTLNGKALKIKIKGVKDKKKVKKAKISGVGKSMKVGASKQLKVSYSPSKATNVEIKFSVNKDKVLTVDKAGKITAKKKGKATVKIKVGNKTIKKKINVK